MRLLVNFGTGWGAVVRCAMAAACAWLSLGVMASDLDPDFEAPVHGYWTRPLKDPFTRRLAQLESGEFKLDATSEKAFVADLLRRLDVPAASQTLVYSTTSLQLSLIRPSNPRAIYFNEDLYVGYVPGGKIEIVSLDPEVGAIFYIFDIPRDAGPPKVQRSDRCMNCHASEDSEQVPGLLLKSVVPGPRGGSLKAFRIAQTGHQIPLHQRFGGWYVTGAEQFTNHWGNAVGQSSAEGLTREWIRPGERFDWARYPAATSDLLAHLVHEHQAGFVNRVLHAAYQTREWLHAGGGKIPEANAAAFEKLARGLVNYMLFAAEAPLPPGGVEGDAEFRAAFQRNRRPAAGGISLKDFELSERLFKHRCSYMIYSGVFAGLPGPMRQAVYDRLREALDTRKPLSEFAYLREEEKRQIRRILKETLADLPPNW